MKANSKPQQIGQSQQGRHSGRLSDAKTHGNHESFRTDEDFFRNVVESMEDYAVFTTDTRGNVSSWNKGAERLLGYKEKEIIGKNADIFYIQEDRTKKDPEVELKVASTKGRAVNERYHQRKDGSKFWGSGLVFPLTDKRGRLRGYTKIMRDLTQQKQTVESLKKWKQIFDNARWGSAIIDAETSTLQEVNKQYAIMHGYRHPKDMVGMKVVDTLAPESRAEFPKHANIANSKGHHMFESIHIHKDGTTYPVLTDTTAFKDNTGKVTFRVATYQDITERKKTEETLRIHMRQQLALNDLGLEALSGADLTELMNRAVKKLIEVLDVDYAKVLELLPDGKDLVLKAGIGWHKDVVIGKSTVDTGKNSQAGYTLLSKNPVVVKDLRTEKRFSGPLLLIKHHVISGMSCIIYGQGKPYGILGVHTTEEREFTDDDINFLQTVANVLAMEIQRIQTEVQLRESEERFRQLADSMPQIVWTAQPDGTTDYYNKQWYDFTGFKPGQPDKWRNILHPDDQEYTMDTWRKSVKTGKPYEIEFRFKNRGKPKSYRWFLGRALPVKDSKGKIIKWFGTCTDIHDIKRTAKRKDQLEKITATLTEQRKQLVALSNAKDEFISLASHQLRTPATGVKQYIGMLLEGYVGRLTKEQKNMLKYAYTSNERQLKIIDDLLKVAHVDAGRVNLDIMPCNLVQLVNSVLHEQSSSFEERKQKLSFKSPREEILVPIDAKFIRMVLDNLVDNASKYTPSTKKIAVSIHKKSRSRIVVIKIRDEGVGIDPQDFPKLFQKFSRLSNPMSHLVGGSGLGLYWVKKIIDLHDGNISVASTPGKGSVFTVELPALP